MAFLLFISEIVLAPDCSWLKLGCKTEDLNLTADEFEQRISEKVKPRYLMKFEKRRGKFNRFAQKSFLPIQQISIFGSDLLEFGFIKTYTKVRFCKELIT